MSAKGNVNALIAAHRAAYDKWELLLGPADARPPKRGAVKARDAAAEEEQATLDALLAFAPQTLKDAAAIAAHLAPLEKGQTLPGNAFSRLLHSLSHSVMQREFGAAGAEPQFLEEKGMIGALYPHQTQGDIVFTKLRNAKAVVIALLNTFDDEITETQMTPEHMQGAIEAIGVLVGDVEGAYRKELVEEAAKTAGA